MHGKNASRFYIYIMAGIYLLYIDYSLIINSKEDITGNKFLTIFIIIFFAVAALGIIATSIKNLKEIKEEEDRLIEEMDKEDTKDE